MNASRAGAAEFAVETIHLDLPALSAAFNRRLHDAGLPTTVERATAFAHALELVRPISRRQLYFTARSVFVSERAQVAAFDAAFAAVFGPWRAGAGQHEQEPGSVAPEAHASAPAPPDGRPPEDAAASEHDRDWVDQRLSDASDASADSDEIEESETRDVLVPMAPSDEELLRDKHFDALTQDELAALQRLMERLALSAPLRRTRRAVRDRHGPRIDTRRTLRASAHTGGDPVRLARRRRRSLPRRIVLLCDISGSMEPYARAYLQFLTCAARSGRRPRDAEAFVFATRLTRITRALSARDPQRAIAQAAAAAPDWSSGTRIGDALKTFNDRHGRRGMARGAVIVILSDGWERADPALVGREMERLSRLAYRIVWVNPRVAATDFAPRAGGMRAALAHCDALLSGHSLRSLEGVADAIGAARSGERVGAVQEPVAAGSPAAGAGSPPAEAAEPEDWPSATPVPGSSVAMPSGYGPSRGRTTPGWVKSR